MRRTLSLICAITVSLFTAQSVSAQNTKKISFETKEVEKSLVESIGEFQINTIEAKYFTLDISTLLQQMNGVAEREVTGSGFVAELQFPHPDGSMNTYFAKANRTMHPDLSARYSQIRSFDANGSEGSFVKWDVTHHGFHAMIMIPGKPTIFIDPVIKGNTEYYVVYRKDKFITDKQKDCSFNSDAEKLINDHAPTSGVLKTFGTCELRTYRAAIAATGEYTIFHGGTVNDALSAQVTTMNRVNGVYEKDMAITMTIIANNDQLIYTSTSDPYTNGNPSAMINENQGNVNTVIGASNYDIGHVFGTNSGGLAGLGVVCTNSQKARGVTGSSAPINDPFDIDYVAHEVGHQFGANHTFNNSCNFNRNDATAMEPGSGSTIMAYAGICTPNVQGNSDDHFHGISLEEISFEILSAGHQCEQITQLGNTAPTIVATNGGSVVPASTPFALTATVTDPDGDPITYNWEQMDNDISTQPPSASSTTGPNFRSWSSSSDSTRFFPRLPAVANNGPFTWERLSSVSRTMNFRVTVRDNAPGPGGCNDHEDVTVTVDGNSGPFEITYPSALGIVWIGTGNQTVTWDVANTDGAPVNCSTVDIYMSDDSGQTYPYVLATDVPNDGSQQVVVPNISTLTARVMVMSDAGTFFDVSNYNFRIQASGASVEELINETVFMFPNPATDEVHIGWQEQVNTIEITDANGKVFKQLNVDHLNESVVDISNMSAGVYFVHVTSNEGRSVYQLIKQ